MVDFTEIYFAYNLQQGDSQYCRTILDIHLTSPCLYHTFTYRVLIYVPE